MLGLKTMLSALVVIAFALPFTFASYTPTPTRTFTVRAYQSPYPAGTGLSGYYLKAEGGSFYLSEEAPKRKPVLSVDHYGQATLVSTGAKVFLDTQDGHLGYTAPSTPAGAIFSNFLHRGAGNAVSQPLSGCCANGPPGNFQWLGSDNFGWFICGSKRQIYKSMTPLVPPDGTCDVVDLAALDG